MEKNKTPKSIDAVKNLLFTLLTCILVAAVALVIVYTSPEGSGTPLNPDDPNTETGTTKIEFVMPVKEGNLIKDYSSTSLMFNSTLKQWEAHKAVDIAVEDKADCFAVYEGEVIKIETTHLLGTIVTIDHGNELLTVYASLDGVTMVEEGQKVKTGEKIGVITTSAKGEINDGPHLHFEVIKDGIKVNPNLYLTFGEK